jgi:diketogulonate reductase-like aldo/keto reductase
MHENRKDSGLSRRQLLKTLSAGILGLPLYSRMVLAGDTGEAHRREIPSSGERLPLIGLGTSRVFEVGADETQRQPLSEVLAALSKVGNAVLDTSPMYGSAEQVAGDLVSQLDVRESLFLATKVWTEGRQQGIEQMNASFELLRTDRMDLMQIHNLVDWETHLSTLREWKAEGRIRYIGVTHYHERAHAPLEELMSKESLDFVQLNYSLAEPQAEARLLPLAAERGIAVIVNRPFARGALFRATKGKELPEWAAEYGILSWAQFFLKWVVSHPAVTVTIPGTGKPRHMLDNLGAAHGPLPDAKQRQRMQALMANLV